MSNDFVVEPDDTKPQIDFDTNVNQGPPSKAVPVGVTTGTKVPPIVPSYIIEQKDFLIERVHDVLSPHVSKKSVNRVLNAIGLGENGLFNQIIDLVYDRDRQTYQCFSDSVQLEHKHQGAVAEASSNGFASFQHQFQFFTNPLSFCSLIDGRYAGPPPKLRIVNVGKVILTYEWDMADVDFLDQQIRWSIVGSDKKSLLDRLYTKLCRYLDFRWLEAVWSAHKSLHLHILVDSRHLYPARFAGEYPLPSGSTGDIPDRLFRNGVMACSALLVPLVQEHLQVGFEPDKSLHEPDRFRRTPWGVRKLPDDNIFGAPAGTRVPQVVLYSKGRSYARTGEDWLLQPGRFFEAERQSRRRIDRPSTTTSAPVDREFAAGFLDALSALCEKLFGPKEAAPFPVTVDKGLNGWRIRFRNNLADHNAGSVMEGHHSTILIGSADPTIKAHRYAFPASADQLVERYLETGALQTRFPTCVPHWTEVQFRNALEWHNSPNPEEFDALDNLASPWGLNTTRPNRPSRISTIPDWLLGSYCRDAAEAMRVLIESMPGAGKTDAIIKAMLDADFDPEHRGFQAVACSSYGQASNKMEEFTSKCDPARSTRRAVLLRAFDDVYREVCPKSRLTVDEAAALGYSTVMEAVYAMEPEVGELLDLFRREMQQGLGFREDGELDYRRRDDVLIFCTHSLIHRWSWRGGSKLWIHPLFGQWQEAKQVGDLGRIRQIQRAVDIDMRLSWVLYDEVSMGDVIVHHPQEQVEQVHEFIAATDRFDHLSAAELYTAWVEYHSAHPDAVSFETMREIVHADYDEDHLITVNPAREHFGINNKPDGLYTGMAGQHHYCKTRDWWDHLPCRISITTTEHKPGWALEQVGQRQRGRNERRRQIAEDKGRSANLLPVWNSFVFDPADYMPAELMRAQVYLDPRVRAPRSNEPDLPSVETISREIREAHPEAWIVSNIINGDRTITPIQAKGSNDFIGQKVFYIMMFLARDRYRDLLIENEVLGWDCAVQLDYLDEFDQIAGRTLGFRYRPGSEFITIISPRLWRQISQTLRLESRFRPELVATRPW